MALPLPRSFAGAYSEAKAKPREVSPNAGLVFDRGAAYWDPAWSGEFKPDDRQKFLDEVTKLVATGAGQTYLSELVQRCRALVVALNGRTFEAMTEWRLVSGLGATHVLDNGFVWDRNLGVPFLPGSSVKGMLRAWAEWRAEEDHADFAEQFGAWFGDTEALGAGSILVHDAFPVRPPVLELDVMSIHARGYYQSGYQVAPRETEAPTVVHFLTIAPETPFLFALSPRPGAHPAPDLVAAEALLRQALVTLGIGAKTAAGYGHFAELRDSR